MKNKNYITLFQDKLVVLLTLSLFLVGFVFAHQLPIEEGQVYVCPLATKIEEINPRCQCRIDLILGETVTSICPIDGKTYEMTLTITEYEGKEYYAILGFENGGAGVNLKPQAKISGKLEGLVGENLKFSAKDSFDPNGDPLEFWWDFGDKYSAKGDFVSHVYENPGTYILTLVVDDGLASSTATTTLTIFSKSFFSGFGGNFSSQREGESEREITKEEKEEKIFSKETKFLAPTPQKTTFNFSAQEKILNLETPNREELVKKEMERPHSQKEVFLASLVEVIKGKILIYFAFLSILIFLIFGIFKVIKHFSSKRELS